MAESEKKASEPKEKEENKSKIKEFKKKYDDEYSILTIVDEEEFEEVIKNLNFDDGKIREWIENKLSE